MRFWILLLLLPLAAHAQTPGTCERGVAEAVLDVNDVRATVFNNGALFFGNVTTDGNGYLVPKGTGHSPLLSVNLWVGGKRGQDIRVAGGLYCCQTEFWPGPLNAGGSLPDAADCAPYDRIYTVSQTDIAHYLSTGRLTDDLRDWPAHLGAPVLNGDGIEGNYNLEGGDQPALSGGQMAWWVMNDVGNEHNVTESEPLGLEVQVSAFAARSAFRPIDQATYYRYRLINRASVAIDSAYIGQFFQINLGDASSDYAHVDTTRGMAVGYNGRDEDAVYGIPPAIGLLVVEGPVGLPNGRDDDRDGMVDEDGERLSLTSAIMHPNVNGPQEDPRTTTEYYRVLRGLWKDGTPLREGGDGWGPRPGPVTTFSFPGDPITEQFWSEENADGSGGKDPPGQRRFSMGIGPFRLGPGEIQEFVVALPFAQGMDRLESVALLRVASDYVREAYRAGTLDPVRVGPAAVEPPDAVEVARPAPNPFTDRAALRFTLPEPMAVRVAVYDALGRAVAVLAEGERAAGPHEAVVEGAGLPAGVYLVAFEAAGERRTFPLVKGR